MAWAPVRVSSAARADRCGQGTELGCFEKIADGDVAHLVLDEREKRAHPKFTRHVFFHPECCPCRDRRVEGGLFTAGLARELASAR